MINPSRTLSVSINCKPEKVYRFVHDPANLPKWAASFVKSVDCVRGEWILKTGGEEMKIRMSPENGFGVLDHYVSPPAGDDVYVPMRVVANGEGSEVFFTLFQYPGMTDEQHEKDREMVLRDLAALKRVMEAG